MFASSDDIHATIIAGAQLADLLVVDFHVAQATWHMAAELDIEIFAEISESRGVLVLSIPLEAPETVSPKAMELALCLNHVWDANAGSRLALESSEGPFWLVADFGLGALEPERFAGFVHDLVRQAHKLRQILQHPAEAAHDSLAALSDPAALRI